MTLAFTDRNEKIVLHSWGRFRARVLAAVVTGDLLGLYGTGDDVMQLANEAATAVGAIAVACQNIAAGETGWCAMAAELKAPTTIGAGGAVTQTYFDDASDTDIGQPLYLNDAGKVDETAGTTTAQAVGYNIARDRIILVPGGNITGAAGSFTSLAASGIVTFTNATESTSSTTGAVKMTGGCGIAKDLWVGIDLDVTGALTIDGASTLTGAVGVAGVLTSGNATEATTSTTGGTIITGGCGMAKDLFIGENLDVTGTATIDGTLTQTGVATFAAQDVHTLGLTVAASKPMIGGLIATPKVTVTTLTSGGGYTLTAAQILGGFISDTTDTGAIAATMPTVALTVAALPGYVVGTSFRFVYKNPGNQTVTLTTGTTWTMVGTMTIATTKQREFICVIAGATTGSVYAMAETAY